MKKRRWKIISEYCLGWTIAFIFLSIVRGQGTTEVGSVQFDLWRSILISIVFGIVFGGISGIIQIYTEEKYYRRISFKKLIISRILFAVVFLVILKGTFNWIFGAVGILVLGILLMLGIKLYKRIRNKNSDA